MNRVSQSMKGKSKSSHDLLKDDPHLSSVPAVERIMNKQIRFEGFCEEITTFWTSSLSIIPYIFQELPENYLTVFVASLCEKGDAAEDSDDDGEYEDAEHDEYVDGDEKNQMRERIAKKLKKDTSENVKRAGEGEVEKKSISRSEELRKEARQLKREL